MKTVRLTAGQALIRFLDRQYVEVDGVESKFVEYMYGIFGHGIVLGLGEALKEQQHRIRFLQGKNEQGMAPAAIAYAKQKNRHAIIPVTSSIGPGALNMVTAAGTATANRVPLLLLPADAFASRQPDPVLQQIEQDHDYTVTANDSFRAISRYWDRVLRPEQILSAAINAMRVLTDPADTGAVTLCLPQDVPAEAFDCPVSFLEKRVHHFSRRPLAAGEPERIAELIQKAERPFLICGGGVRYSDAGASLADLAADFGIPIGETQAGKGVISWDHPMNLGGLGVTGTQAANRIAKKADLLIAVGTRLNDFHTASRSLFAHEGVPLVTINVNAMDAHKSNATPFLCDARAGLEQVAAVLRKSTDGAGAGGPRSRAILSEIEEQKTLWSKEADRLRTLPDEGLVSQTRAIGTLNDFMGPEDVVVAASGSLPSDLERLWRPKGPDSYHLEYGFSCMGYEVAGALGVKLAVGDAGNVYALLGDGAFVMLHSELLTAVQEQKKIVLVVVDNSGFHCIDNLQGSVGIDHFACEFRYRDSSTGELSGDEVPVDYAAIGRAYGCATYTVSSAEEFEHALAAAQSDPVPVLIHVHAAKKSMTGGYDANWRVGIPEVSTNPALEQAQRDQALWTQEARAY